MRKLTEREYTLGAVINKVNEIVNTLNNLPAIPKVELPKETTDASAFKAEIKHIYEEMDKISESFNSSLQRVVKSVNDNFARINEILKGLDNGK